MAGDDTGRRSVLMAAAAVAVGLGTRAVSAAPAIPPHQLYQVASLRDLANLATTAGTAWLAQTGREGMFLWRLGDHGAKVAADRLQGLYVASASDPSGRNGCWVRYWDETIGRPEWFGAEPGDPAQDCLAALEACAMLCQTVRLSPVDYYIRDSWRMQISGRNIIGSAGSGSTVGYGVDLRSPLGTADGTRVILTGANVVSSPVFIFGSHRSNVDNLSIMRNSHVCDIMFARDCSAYKPRPGQSDDHEDCVKGVVLCYFADCTVSGLKSYDSPVGFHCFGIVYSLISGCNARRVTPASSPRRDFWVGWLVGGYDDSMGYFGSNASIYIEHCSVFDSNSAFDTSIGMKLYGRISDSFISFFEMARLDYGVVIDGSDRSGHTLLNMSHQDVTFTNPVVDGYTKGGFVIRNLHDYNCLDIVTPYAAGGGLAIDITDAAGNITISGGKLLAAGVRVRNVNGFSLLGTLIRDALVPVELINVGMFRVEPNIFNLGTVAVAGCVLKHSFRGILAPQIRGAPAKLQFGVMIDATSGLVTIDETAIDPGCFITISAVNKVRFGNQDAHLGAGSNILTGTAG